MLNQVYKIVKDVPIPKMVKVRQTFDRVRVEDPAAELKKELSRAEITGTVRPGMKVAIAVGSRGIEGLPVLVRTIADFLKENGAEPFIAAAMGSHGGACAEGQRAILEGFGITEESVGCPLRVTSETTVIGTTPDGLPVQIDKNAAAADGIVLINHIKPHTGFRGEYESGLMKMLAIGLAKQPGAEYCHFRGFRYMHESVPKFGKAIMASANIMFGVGIVKNAYDEIAEIRAMTDTEIVEKEPQLLKRAKELYGRIWLDHVDVLVVDEISKHLSGDGMDPCITGRFGTPYAGGGIDATRVCVLDIMEESHRSGSGLGLADCTTEKAFAKYDRDITYANAITSRVLVTTKIPTVLPNEKMCIQTAIITIDDTPAEEVTLVRIKNTKKLEYILISENLVEEAKKSGHVEILSEPFEMELD